MWWAVSESHRDEAWHGVKDGHKPETLLILVFPNTSFVSI